MTQRQGSGGLTKGPEEDILDERIRCGFVYVFMAAQSAEIGHRGVTEIVYEKLSLDVEGEGGEGNETVDLRDLPSRRSERFGVGGKLAVYVRADREAAHLQELFGGRRNGDAHRNAHKTNRVFKIILQSLRDEGLDEPAKVFSRTDEVLAYEYVERSFSGRVSFFYRARDDLRDERKNVHSESGSHNVARRYLVRRGFGVASVDRCHVLNPFGVVVIAARNEDRVFSLFFESFDQTLVDVDEHCLIACKEESFGYKSSSDVSGSVHYRFHMSLVPPGFLTITFRIIISPTAKIVNNDKKSR